MASKTPVNRIAVSSYNELRLGSLEGCLRATQQPVPVAMCVGVCCVCVAGCLFDNAFP